MREDDLAAYAGHSSAHSSPFCLLLNGLAGVVKKVIKSDLTWRLRAFWIMAALTLAVVFVGVGGGFAFGGTSAVYSIKPFRIITTIFPGSIEAHGVFLLTIGSLLLICIGITLSGIATKIGREFVLLVSVLTMCYSVWCFIAYLGAWYVNNHFTPGVFWYAGASILSSALAFLPPPFILKGMRDGRS